MWLFFVARLVGLHVAVHSRKHEMRGLSQCLLISSCQTLSGGT
jgi:hypothetical protein